MTLTRLSERRFTIGGSECAAACGVNPYDSRVALWARKTGRLPAPQESEAMLWGTLIEPLILDVLSRHGFALLPAPDDGFRDDERPWMVGHPDAFAEKDGRRYVVDAKTTSSWNAHAWDDNGAPIQYVLQLHHYMHLTGDDVGLLACLVGGQRLHLRIVERDEAVRGLMLLGLREFAEYVQSDSPPPPDGSDSAADTLRALHPAGTQERVRLDRAGMAAVARLRELERQYQAVKRQRDEQKQTVQMLMGDAEVAVALNDDVVAKWTTYERQGKPARRFTVA